MDERKGKRESGSKVSLLLTKLEGFRKDVRRVKDVKEKRLVVKAVCSLLSELIMEEDEGVVGRDVKPLIRKNDSGVSDLTATTESVQDEVESEGKVDTDEEKVVDEGCVTKRKLLKRKSENRRRVKKEKGPVSEGNGKWKEDLDELDKDCEDGENKKKRFECGNCGKKFLFACYLRDHELTHTNSRPIRCDACPKRFRLNHHLKRHKRTHNGEKPYECRYCGRSFNQDTGLKKHELTHTGKDLKRKSRE